jgi:hypothetical protein
MQQIAPAMAQNILSLKTQEPAGGRVVFEHGDLGIHQENKTWNRFEKLFKHERVCRWGRQKRLVLLRLDHWNESTEAGLQEQGVKVSPGAQAGACALRPLLPTGAAALASGRILAPWQVVETRACHGGGVSFQ